MERLVIQGGKRLNGEISVQGAKNSALPILAGTLLFGGVTVLHNCPRLSDVEAAIKILQYLGCKVEWQGKSLLIDSSVVNNWDVPQKLMHEMRSSIVFLGAIISRQGKASLCFPGGCELGARPIDLHISSLQKLGVDIVEEYGLIKCECPNGICGKKIILSFPSVGATENIILATVLGKGETVIVNAAQEPEIVDLANYLIKRGAKIKGAGESCIVIQGVDSLSDCEYDIMPDRIVATTLLCCGAITGGEIVLNKVNPNDLESVLPILEQSGCKINIYNDKIKLKGASIINGVKNIRTMPYPGFPTDAQAPIMAMLSVAKSTSIFVENIFESRYKHVGELVRMGADIKVEGRVAVVSPVAKLYGADVSCTDLRGGASLCVAGVAVNGITTISEIHHIDRGYQSIENQLSVIGADIKRVV